MKNVLCASSLGLGVRKHLLKCYIWSVLLYGCESWTINKNIEQKLKATEIWLWRKKIRIAWTEKLTNEVVLEKVGSQRQLLTTSRRQWRFVGHELRIGGIEKNILEAEMTGKRAGGRQRLKMLGWIMERFRVEDGKQLANVARDRKRWRENRHDPSTVLNAMTL